MSSSSGIPSFPSAISSVILSEIFAIKTQKFVHLYIFIHRCLLLTTGIQIGSFYFNLEEYVGPKFDCTVGSVILVFTSRSQLK